MNLNAIVSALTKRRNRARIFNVKTLLALAFSFLVLFGTIEPVAAADPTPVDTLSEIFNKKPDAKADGDIFHLWMELTFGKFIWAPWGEGCDNDSCATILAKTISFTNVLALMLGIIIAYYVVLGGAVNTGHTGEVLGKSWSSVWLPLRSAFGFWLILPINTVGGGVFSAAQLFTVWIIILGSNAGTVAWETVATEFTKGTPVVSVPASHGMAPASDLFTSLMCVRGALETARDKGKTGPIARVFFYGKNHKTISSKSGSNLSTSFLSYIKDKKVKQIELGLNGICGSLNFPDLTAPKGDDVSNKILATTVELFKKDIYSMSSKLIKLTNDVYNSYDGSGSAIIVGNNDKDEKVLKSLDDWGLIFNTTALSFDMNVRKNVAEGIKKSKVMEGAKAEMTKGGWAKAGLWYFEVSKYQGKAFEATRRGFEMIGKPGSADVCGSLSEFFGTCSSDNLNAMIKAASLIKTTGLSIYKETARKETNNKDSFSTDGETYLDASSTMDMEEVIRSPESAKSSFSGWVTRSILSPLTTKNAYAGQGMYGETCIENTKSDFKTTTTKCGYGMSNPFYTVSTIGHNAINVAIGAYAFSSLLHAATGAVDGAMSSGMGMALEFGGAGVASELLIAMFDVLKYTLIALCGVLIGQGFVLAFAIPFMPLLTWIMMVCGYLLVVVEATVAAPLAVIMMVTPEGDGIMGTRMQSSLNMIMAIVLKPSLMVIGLVASLTLGNIFFAIVNDFFWSGTNELMTASILEILFLLSLYLTLAYKICQYTVSVMYKLPDQILDWLAPGGSRPFGESDITAAAEGAAGAAGSGASQIAGGIAEGQQKVKTQKAMGGIDDPLEKRLAGIQANLNGGGGSKFMANRGV